MGYRTSELPPVELDEFAKIPFLQRMKLLQLHWVQYGFGTPKQTMTGTPANGISMRSNGSALNSSHPE